MQRLEYEWVSGVQYQNRIGLYLQEIDEIMIPTLSERVCIWEYAGKLARLAETLYIVQEECDIASCSVYCNSKVAFISSIAVKREFLGKGIGSILMDEVKRHVREKKCESVQLEVYTQNTVAIKFYVKNGFTVLAENDNVKKMEYLFEVKENKMSKTVNKS